ncbi:hypothetical protein Ndes2526B_g04950 [Nannochloris sp. 'desiccata']
MSLKGKTAVITGGSGIVGSGIVHQFLKEGAKVIAPVRTEKGRQALLKDLEKLHYKIDIAKKPCYFSRWQLRLS